MSTKPSWTNPVLWVLALLLINVLWNEVAQQEAPNEINSMDQFASVREVNVAPVFGSEASIPATFTTEFSSTRVEGANVSVTLKLNNQTVVFAWSGDLGDSSPTWTGALEPGRYTVITEIEDGVDVEQSLDLAPFEAVRWQGHLLLSGLLVVLAVVEQAVRGARATRQATSSAKEQKSPFRPAPNQPEADMAWDENESPWRDPLRGS